MSDGPSSSAASGSRNRPSEAGAGGLQQPQQCVLSPAEDYLYVSALGSDRVHVLRTSDNVFVATAEVGEEIGRLKQGLALIAAELAHYGRDRTPPQEGDTLECARHVAAERFMLVMQPFYDGAQPQLDELVRASEEMEAAQTHMKTYFAEEAKASLDEIHSRWATFLGHVDAAAANISDDRKRRK